MYPLKHTPLRRLFPKLCCCISFCLRNSKAEGSLSFKKLNTTDVADKEDELDFDDDNKRLDNIATKYNAGTYRGTDFIEDCMQKY